ncbi:MAG: hypothetical protein LBQ52_03125 [Helicobacteraceae bacterium]|nr:hypothetical protein [Helicobacteraceae bacterium]
MAKSATASFPRKRESKYDGFCVVRIQAYKQPKAIAVRRSLVWIPAYAGMTRSGGRFAGMTAFVGFIENAQVFGILFDPFGF